MIRSQSHSLYASDTAERDTIENKISDNAAQKYKFLIFLFLVSRIEFGNKML